MSDDLAYLPAIEAARLFRERELSPVELLRALIERSERIEPLLNAFAATYFDEALEQARRAEARFMTTDGQPRALEGLPLVVKSDLDSAIRGKVSSDGALWLKDAVQRHTSPSIERLLDAGAIVHAQTTMPELGWSWTCHSRLHGTTRNPWNPALTCGGSSGGSAASLAAGLSTLATGTDCLGSLRHPSAMCGILGYKPPYGRNPQHSTVQLDFFTHIGPMARSVADCILVQNVMAGPHPLDHTTVTPKVTLASPVADLEGIDIAYSLDLGCFPVTDDVRRETLASLDALQAAGATTTEVAVDWAQEVVDASSDYLDRLYGDEFVDAIRDHPGEICESTPYYAQEASRVTAEQFHVALETAGAVWRDHFGPLFQRFDAFLCPTLAFHHVPADNLPWQRNIPVGGALYTDHDGVMTGLFNMFSRCPVLATPSGFTDGGLPTSVQIAARPYDDAAAFRVAAALERARPWLDAPERRPKLAPTTVSARA
ncbi:MAG: amidase [Acidobacteriota bacterium]